MPIDPNIVLNIPTERETQQEKANLAQTQAVTQGQINQNALFPLIQESQRLQNVLNKQEAARGPARDRELDLANETAEAYLRQAAADFKSADWEAAFDAGLGTRTLWDMRDPKAIGHARNNKFGDKLARDMESYFTETDPATKRIHELEVEKEWAAFDKAREEFEQSNSQQGAPKVNAVRVASNGEYIMIGSDFRVQGTGKYAPHDLHFYKVKELDENGEIIETEYASPKQLRDDGSFGVDFSRRFTVERTDDTTGAVDLQNPQVVPDLQPGVPGALPQIQINQGVQTVGGLEAQAGAQERGRLTEQRFSKLIEEAPKDLNMSRFISTLADTALDSAIKAKKEIVNNNLLTTGFGAKVFIKHLPDGEVEVRTLPGSMKNPALRVFSLMNQFFGGAAFSTLQTMRAASPTGGALGQVSNFEIGLLKAQWGAFLQEADAEFNLQQLDVLIDRAKLIQEVSAIEIAAYGQMSTMGVEDKEAIRAIQRAAMNQIDDVFAAHGRTSGKWNMEEMKYEPPDKDLGNEEFQSLTGFEEMSDEEFLEAIGGN